NKRKKEIMVPLFIFIFFLPIMASIYYELNILSFFAQMLFLPIFFLFYLISLLSFFTFNLFSILNFFGNAIATSFVFITNLELTVLTGASSPVFIILFYTGYFMMLLGLETKHKKKIELGLTCVLTSMVISVLPIKNVLTNSVTFINVGQGDSILIREGQNTVLIDTGGSIYFDIATECLIPYFKKEKISKIDYLITTHNDNDHNGGKESLMNKFRVQNYVSLFQAFPLQFGSLNLVNLNTYATDQTDDNDSSLFLYLEFLNRKWLFTGDASTVIETKIIKDNPNLDVDILKVGHHGSDSSTSDAFLQAITPTEAIISVGKNIYGHPTAKVLARLAKYGIKVRRTDIEGTISYTEWTF
ncbi:MAG: ComEC/Rec2 family competence protein, partial [Firmicutes bacterium]|nr:ComEC/Rec2 family competence protein [Bacillota bacterium]